MRVKVQKFLLFLISILALNVLNGCYSESIELLHARQFELRTQIIALKKQEKNNLKKTSKQNKNVAGLHSNLDEFSEQIHRIDGQIDTIKKGFELGRLPDASDNDFSIDSRIRGLDKRLLLVEETQGEILRLLETIEQNSSKKTKRSKRHKISSLKEAEEAFKQKRYIHIIRDLPKALDSSKTKGKTDLSYYYAQSLFKVGRIHQAALAFKDIEDSKKFSSEHKKRMIKLRLGDCFRHLGDNKTALVYYTELLDKYPSSKEAGYAKDYLKKIKKL
jgi:tetratricopeptide (TPR) repeat protein